MSPVFARDAPGGFHGPSFPGIGHRRSPGNGVCHGAQLGRHPRELMTVAHCRKKDGNGTVDFSTLPSRAEAMANAKCRTCDEAAAAGAYCSSCAADIMANAFNPFYGGRRKKLPGQQGRLPSRPAQTFPKPSSQLHLFRS